MPSFVYHYIIFMKSKLNEGVNLQTFEATRVAELPAIKTKLNAVVAAVAVAVGGCAGQPVTVVDPAVQRAETVAQPQNGCSADALDCEVTFGGGKSIKRYPAPDTKYPRHDSFAGGELK